MAATMSIEQLRSDLSRRKQLDKVFVVIGLTVMFACLGLLAILFFDLVRNGAERFGWDFLTKFPSRKAENAAPVMRPPVGSAEAPSQRHGGATTR